jgi:pimeloyl-ACP methyl ester carboxylesterase
MTELSTKTVRGLPVPADLKTTELRGVGLAYLERGSGQPVVFVHGSISDLTIWESQLGPIGESYRAIAYSRRLSSATEKCRSIAIEKCRSGGANRSEV